MRLPVKLPSSGGFYVLPSAHLPSTHLVDSGCYASTGLFVAFLVWLEGSLGCYGIRFAGKGIKLAFMASDALEIMVAQPKEGPDGLRHLRVSVSNRLPLYVEADLHHIAVLHHVIATFQAQQPAQTRLSQ